MEILDYTHVLAPAMMDYTYIVYIFLVVIRKLPQERDSGMERFYPVERGFYVWL